MSKYVTQTAQNEAWVENTTILATFSNCWFDCNICVWRVYICAGNHIHMQTSGMESSKFCACTTIHILRFTVTVRFATFFNLRLNIYPFKEINIHNWWHVITIFQFMTSALKVFLAFDLRWNIFLMLGFDFWKP